VSNGSGINLRADKPPMWKEVGTPVTFFVGEKDEAFGADPERFAGPHYHDHYLPIVSVGYTAAKVGYRQIAFASVREPLAAHGAVFVRFEAAGPGRVVSRLGTGEKFAAAVGEVFDSKGRTVVRFGPEWRWNAEKAELVAKVDRADPAELLVFTKPAEKLDNELPTFAKEVDACANMWNKLLKRGTQLELPEPVVSRAWPALIAGNYMIAVGDRMHYSAGNAYDHLYEAECGDAVRSLMLFGQIADAKKMLGPLLDFDRKATRFHVAGHKLQLLAHYYWVTRDTEYIKESRAKWEPVVKSATAARPTTAFCRRTTTPAT
jgi:hypothetical protein